MHVYVEGDLCTYIYDYIYRVCCYYLCICICMYIGSSAHRPNRLELEKKNLFATTTPFCILLFFFVCFRILPPVDLYTIYCLLATFQNSFPTSTPSCLCLWFVCFRHLPPADLPCVFCLFLFVLEFYHRSIGSDLY